MHLRLDDIPAMQILSVSELNLRSLPQRIGSSLVVIVGIAGVVAVFISILSLAIGFKSTIANTGQPDRAIVMGRGWSSEGYSTLSRDDVRSILDTPGIKVGPNGKPAGSA